ncbi:homoserine kinase [Segetibacter sp. 3557_3]|uniref:homoserine kinase n=1 Tax=Segetibacter sp. 3557_3 TaxID=2547429 RepID=UPI001058EFBC|nr:homoserine kinase [Segetibacter sp. 3557_3]TDH28966.1 homoserine kinase [Segetibacter sp. 3557_3]
MQASPHGKSITVHAPGTVANLVCGFDVLGMCLNEPHDIMHVTLLDERKVVIESLDGYPLPSDPQQNTAGAPLIEMLHELDRQIGFHVQIKKQIKPGSGIGSSAASAAGAVVAANHLLNNVFTNTEMVRFAMAGEKVASGVKHADNVAPCIYGGITLIRSIFPLDIIAIPAPDLYVTVVHPQIEVRTADARQILRKEVLLKDAIKQWGNIAGLVAGFMKGDLELIGRSLEDVIIEPVRSILIPGFNDVKTRCRQAGALGGGISGSGPSIFMLSRDKQTADNVEGVMQEIYTAIGIDFHTYVTTINKQGVTVALKELNPIHGEEQQITG